MKSFSIKWAIFSMFLFMLLTQMASAAPSAGLLRGITPDGEPTLTSMTDGDDTTQATLQPTQQYTWTFSSTIDVSGYYIHGSIIEKLRFFDSNNNLLGEVHGTGIGNPSTVYTSSNFVGVKKIIVSNDHLTNTYKIGDIDLQGTVVPSTPIGTIPPAPANLTATAGDTQVRLNWSAVSDATEYKVKRSVNPNGPYTIISTTQSNSYDDSSVLNGTTYYYIITAVNSVGESESSNEASATPLAPIVNRALLVITLASGLEKEYDLSMSEVNNFISWYNDRASGSDYEVYIFNKSYNLANFLSRKDYIAFSKIETFEVNEYAVE